jgi:RNA-directed DNA polymerase
MDALVVAIESRKVNFILDADIRSFFDTVDQEWLIRFVEHRVGDRRIVRLIGKWLKAGVLEDGILNVSEKGTGQGAVISPLLANIYLHYGLDQWAEGWRRHKATGDMIIVRYADDFIIGFEHESDARCFLDAMRERLGKFALSLHSEKTRLIEFGRYAARNASGVGSASRRPSISWASASSAANRAGANSKSNGNPGATACDGSCKPSSRNCDNAFISQSLCRENG